MWFGSSEDAAKRLEAEAHARLQDGDLDAALSLSEQLLEMGWSGGFEVRALALAQGGRSAEAIATLEGAVEKAPSVWSLWQLLGNLRSDAGDLDGAIEALTRALRCDGVSESTVRFNRAIAHQRRKDPGAALDDLEPVLALPRPPDFAEDALSLAAQCLAELGRRDEAVSMIEIALDACAEDDPRRPRLFAELAVALDRAAKDATSVRDAFERATEGGATTTALLSLGRRLDPEPAGGGSPITSRRRRLVVQAARAMPGGAALSFLRVFDVVATSPEEALTMSRRYLEVSSRDGARIERCDELEEAIGLELGVYAASAPIYFEDDDE